ncbi:hypothetical protein [Actinopolymorpha alba]|uniref:hypothetical protein n=1 Tax=Actinopolymorpha alba TaxID=533267 RepID=UPI00036A3074|nr:hypothetical protein [Actinopolymorpha alba]
MSSPWNEALAGVAAKLNHGSFDWMLVGSAATALRGVAVEPGDIDVAVSTAEDVARAATLLPTPEATQRQDPRHEPGDPATWLSTTAEPTLRFGDAQRWTFGRWLVNGVKVELAHIEDPTAADLMIETRGPLVWRARTVVDCHGHPIPTVPIEVQIATMLARQQAARIEATIAVIDSLPLNVALLRRAISDRQAEGFTITVPDTLRGLLAQQRTATERTDQRPELPA